MQHLSRWHVAKCVILLQFHLLYGMTISIIIPTLNEAALIERLISFVQTYGGDAVLEIIVADGGSTDDTLTKAHHLGARVITVPQPGRAIQMNAGASLARGELLYFIHADTLPPASFAMDIQEAIRSGVAFGRYRTQFDSNRWLLKCNAFFTRFDWPVCYGGDQTLFISASFFSSLGGYDENLLIMEEYELTARAKRFGKYIVLPKAALVSARKYELNSWWRVQRANYLVVKMYQRGSSQQLLINRYQQLLRSR